MAVRALICIASWHGPGLRCRWKRQRGGGCGARGPAEQDDHGLGGSGQCCLLLRLVRTSCRACAARTSFSSRILAISASSSRTRCRRRRSSDSMRGSGPPTCPSRAFVIVSAARNSVAGRASGSPSAGVAAAWPAIRRAASAPGPADARPGSCPGGAGEAHHALPVQSGDDREQLRPRREDGDRCPPAARCPPGTCGPVVRCG
jgi:hypothetical protein